MPTYSLEEIHTVSIAPGSPLDGMDLMSPYVWTEEGAYRIMLRGVPAGDDPVPTGVIASGSSADGLVFTLDPKLAIAPGTGPDDPDAGGCEDPTVVIGKSGEYLVYYTGVDAARRQGSMIVAEGPTLSSLIKRAVVLKAPPGEGNIKEATIVWTSQGHVRLFYEYAQDNASRIGIAVARRLGEHWATIDDPFSIRDDSWDDWHLSTGPVCQLPGADPVMFYNGATADARWRIGWISFDPDYTRITGRGITPVVLPPPPRDRAATDIAFAASTVIKGGLIRLYYSLEDRTLRRATIRYYA